MAVSPYRFDWDDADEELESSDGGKTEDSETGYIRKVKDVASEYIEDLDEGTDELMRDNKFWFSLGLGPMGLAAYASYKAGGATAEYMESRSEEEQSFWSDYDENIDLNSLDYTPEDYGEDNFWESTVNNALDMLDKPLDQMQDYKDSLSDKYSDFKDQTGDYISAAVDKFREDEDYDFEEYESESDLSD